MNNKIISVSIERVRVDPVNMRAGIPIGKTREKYIRGREHVRKNGIETPLEVRPDPERGEGYYKTYAGGRRLEWAKDVGLKEIPIVVKDLSDREAFLRSVSENVNIPLTFYDDIYAVQKAEKILANSPVDLKTLANGMGYSKETTRKILMVSHLPYNVLIFAKELYQLTEGDKEVVKRYSHRMVHRPNHGCLNKQIFYRLGTLWDEKAWGREHICTPEELLQLVIFLIHNRLENNEAMNFIQFCEKQMRHGAFTSPNELFRDYRPLTHSKKGVTIYLDPIVYGKLAGEAFRSHRHIRLIIEEAIAKFLGFSLSS